MPNEPEAHEQAEAHSTWQDNMTTRMASVEANVRDLRTDFQTFDARYTGDIYDLQTQMRVLRMAQDAHMA